MTAKDYLKQLKKLDTKINQRIQEKETLRHKMFSTGGSMGSGDRVQTSPNGDGIPNAVAAYMDMEKEIDALIDQYVDQKHKIIGQIQSLQSEQDIQILYKRYVEFKSFEQIAVELMYSFEYCLKLHGWALQHFEPLLKSYPVNIQ